MMCETRPLHGQPPTAIGCDPAVKLSCSAAVVYSSCHVCGPFDDTDDVVALREERHPVIQCGLLLLVKILPLGADILGFGGGLSEGSRGVFTSKDYAIKRQHTYKE